MQSNQLNYADYSIQFYRVLNLIMLITPFTYIIRVLHSIIKRTPLNYHSITLIELKVLHSLVFKEFFNFITLFFFSLPQKYSYIMKNYSYQ